MSSSDDSSSVSSASDSSSRSSSSGSSSGDDSSSASSSSSGSSSSSSSSGRRSKRSGASRKTKGANGAEAAVDAPGGGMPWSSGLLKIVSENGGIAWKKDDVVAGIAATILAEQGRSSGAPLEITPEALAVFEATLHVEIEKLALGMEFASWAARKKGIHYADTPAVAVHGEAPADAPKATPRTLAMVVNYERGIRAMTIGPCKPRVSVDAHSSIPSVCIPMSKSKIAKAKRAGKAAS